jgi:N-acetylglutamate synthase-like GNAT family acetyltransferase
MEKKIGDITYSTNKALLDIPFIHAYLSQESYWAHGIPLKTVEKAVEGSLCFGVYDDHKQIGFARVITDGATFGYLADVFVLGERQKKGIGKNLMEFIMEVTDQMHFRRFMLATLDAHGLYKKYGFKKIQNARKLMEVHKPDIYGDEENPCR